MKKDTTSSQNAVKSGMYARGHLLRGEDPAQYERLRREIVDLFRPANAVEKIHVVALVENLWRGQRLQRSTAVGADRHAFGRALEESGAALDEEDDFKEYMSEELERRIRIENSVWAQFDKIRARLLTEQEARALRDKVRKSEEAAGKSTVEQSHDDVAEASKLTEEPPSGDGREKLGPAELDSDDAWADFLSEPSKGEGLDTAELDRDDDDTDEWGEPKRPVG